MVEDKILPDRLYTRDEVARLMHVTPRTVSRWLHAGKLTAYGPGRRPLFLGRDILQIPWQPEERASRGDEAGKEGGEASE